MTEKYITHKCIGCGDEARIPIPTKYECWPTKDWINYKKLLEFVRTMSKFECCIRDSFCFNTKANNVLKEIGEL